MVANLIYRTDDITRWGSGQGSDLAAVTIDLNFWTLWSAINTIQTTPSTARGIDYISQVSGNQLFVHLTDHSVLGPFTVPTEIWNPRGNWYPAITYAPLDVVSENGALYLVNVPHTSAATFNPNATDGLGHNLYTLLLEQPMNELPAAGTVGQRLAKSSGSPYVTEWVSDKVRLAYFNPNQPAAGELSLQYANVDTLVLPAGLAGSVAYAAIPPHADSTYTLNRNGTAIGSITFHAYVGSPTNGVPAPTVSFPSAITCNPGDIITMTGPPVQDPNLAQVSITLVGLLED